MIAVIIRHGKVDFKWKSLYSSGEFNTDCEKYDRAHVLPEAYPVPDMDQSRIYVSSLSRTRETARNLFGDVETKQTGLIDEVPMSASLDAGIRLPLLFWKITGRLQWLVGSRRQKENRMQTLKRAARFTDMLLKRDEDCVVVTHGFFMHVLIHEMKKKGFSVNSGSLMYANGDYVIACKPGRGRRKPQ